MPLAEAVPVLAHLLRECAHRRRHGSILRNLWRSSSIAASVDKVEVRSCRSLIRMHIDGRSRTLSRHLCVHSSSCARGRQRHTRWSSAKSARAACATPGSAPKCSRCTRTARLCASAASELPTLMLTPSAAGTSLNTPPRSDTSFRHDSARQTLQALVQHAQLGLQTLPSLGLPSVSFHICSV